MRGKAGETATTCRIAAASTSPSGRLLPFDVSQGPKNASNFPKTLALHLHIVDLELPGSFLEEAPGYNSFSKGTARRDKQRSRHTLGQSGTSDEFSGMQQLRESILGEGLPGPMR